MRDEGALELIRVHIRLWRVFAGFDGNPKQNLQNELGSKQMGSFKQGAGCMGFHVRLGAGPIPGLLPYSLDEAVSQLLTTKAWHQP